MADPEFERLIEKAKRQVELWYQCVGKGREWLTAEPIKSYGSATHRVETFVLQGSPAKGIVLADWGSRTVRAVSVCNYQTRSYKQGIWHHERLNEEA